MEYFTYNVYIGDMKCDKVDLEKIRFGNIPKLYRISDLKASLKYAIYQFPGCSPQPSWRLINIISVSTDYKTVPIISAADMRKKIF